jgi:hippurate hydrolase
MSALRPQEVTVKQGATTSASDSIVITFHGGRHGSMPDKSIDPIVMGARFVEDVQTVISRQKDPQKFGVVTVGSFHAGTVGNIIPDRPTRALAAVQWPGVRKLLQWRGIRRAPGAMSRAPRPSGAHAWTAPTLNDPARRRGRGHATQALGKDHVTLVPVTEPGWTASEDFSESRLLDGADTFSAWAAIPPLAEYKAEGKRCRSTTHLSSHPTKPKIHAGMEGRLAA